MMSVWRYTQVCQKNIFLCLDFGLLFWTLCKYVLIVGSQMYALEQHQVLYQNAKNQCMLIEFILVLLSDNSLGDEFIE